jgi:hypothetical protein
VTILTKLREDFAGVGEIAHDLAQRRRQVAQQGRKRDQIEFPHHPGLGPDVDHLDLIPTGMVVLTGSLKVPHSRVGAGRNAVDIERELLHGESYRAGGDAVSMNQFSAALRFRYALMNTSISVLVVPTA